MQRNGPKFAKSWGTSKKVSPKKPSLQAGQVGIVQQIRLVKTGEEVKELLTKASGFQFISPVTMRKLRKLAQGRA